MQQRGFTLIELIIVIVILGILAVTAAPRFLDLTDDAESASMAGIAGAVRSSSDIVRASSLVNKADALDSGTIELDDGPYNLTDGLYLESGDLCKSIGLLSTSQTGTANDTTLDGAFECRYTHGTTDGSDPSIVVIRPLAATEDNDCYVRYNDRDGSATKPTITQETVCEDE